MARQQMRTKFWTVIEVNYGKGLMDGLDVWPTKLLYKNPIVRLEIISRQDCAAGQSTRPSKVSKSATVLPNTTRNFAPSSFCWHFCKKLPKKNLRSCLLVSVPCHGVNMVKYLLALRREICGQLNLISFIYKSADDITIITIDTLVLTLVLCSEISAASFLSFLTSTLLSLFLKSFSADALQSMAMGTKQKNY